MTVENIINKLSKFTYDINKKYKFSKLFTFEVLVGLQFNNLESTLTYISEYGTSRPINEFRIIGTGGKYAKVFMKKIWNKEMRMEEVAELGYFIIKYIENFELDYTVGVGEKKPEIWYIPNKYTESERKKIFDSIIKDSKIVKQIDDIVTSHEIFPIFLKYSNEVYLKEIKKDEKAFRNSYKSIIMNHHPHYLEKNNILNKSNSQWIIPTNLDKKKIIEMSNHYSLKYTNNLNRQQIDFIYWAGFLKYIESLFISH